MDNITAPATGAVLATKDIGNVQFPKNLLTDFTGADVLGLVADDPDENTLLGRLKAIVTAIEAGGGGGSGDATAANQVTGNGLLADIKAATDGLEGLVTTTNALLTALGTNTDTLETLATTLNGYVDGLEALVGTSNTTLTTIAGYVDGLEAAAAAQLAALATVGTRAYGTPLSRLAVASTSAQSAAITATEVLVHASTRCFILAGANPTATVDAIPLEAGEKFHLRITSGQKIAVIRDTADGFLNIIPVA